MRKLIIIAAVAFAAVSSFGASKAATEAWVTNRIANTAAEYLANAVVTRTNDVTYIQIAGGVLTIEDSSVYALEATNVVIGGGGQGANISNGTIFVWDEIGHGYTNRTERITATESNFVWRGQQSVGSTFSNEFTVAGRMLQPSVAREATR